MAHTTAFTRAPAASLSARVRTFMDGMARRRQQRAAYDQTVRELSVMTDRELNDLGIARADIRRIAYAASREAA